MKRTHHFPMTRRQFLATSLAAAGAAVIGGCGPHRGHRDSRTVIVLGIDGMDPGILESLMQRGQMPACRRLAEQGCFARLGTTTPPQSPVAWASFISGTNPGGHGIFDFIARDPATLTPYFAASRVEPASWPGGRHAVNLRKGPTLWESLAEHGVDCVISRMPANYPPTPCRARMLSGLGTPDLKGTYGTFTHLTDDPSVSSHDVPGGRIERVHFTDNTAEGRIEGPEMSGRGSSTVQIKIVRDPESPVARISVGESICVLQEGDWSEWSPVRFSRTAANGMCRLFLKKARHPFSLYVSPVNIDPTDPVVQISTPGSYARELAYSLGRFHTQGMPEDTRALSAGVLSDDEYRQQALLMLQEQERLFEYQLGSFERGLFFFYFSTLDLNSHAFWRAMDSGHPLYSPELARNHGDFIPSLYRRLDKSIEKAMERMDDQTWLFVVSDHGFAPFRRQFNLNTWLLENGYLTLSPGGDAAHANLFGDIDWTRTQAYGLGINSLYINLQGREPNGCVPPGNKESLARRLAEELASVRDPATGEAAMARVYLGREAYSGPYVDSAPDLVLGYNRNYRASWETVLGTTSGNIFSDNLDPWSGDHAMDAGFLPGVILSNRYIETDSPTLMDMAPSILAAFGVPSATGMTGRNLLL